MACCAFLRRPSSLSRLGYRALPADGCGDSAVTVVVGKERRVFSVDPFVLEEAPFRVLMEMMREKRQGREGMEMERERKRGCRKDVIFVDIDAILFEHMLWLTHNDCSSSSSSLFHLNLKDIIEFYSQDS